MMIATNTFAEAGPIFGGARLPNGQRLGASVNSDQMQRPHSLWILWKWFGRSGASPHQGCGDQSPLMTKNNFFVPYLNHLGVPL